MNCITDFLPDDTNENNADGESIEEIVFGIQPAPETLTPSELDAAVYGGNPSAATVAGFALDEINRLERERDNAIAIERALADASIEAHTETLQRVKALEAENARLRGSLERILMCCGKNPLNVNDTDSNRLNCVKLETRTALGKPPFED